MTKPTTIPVWNTGGANNVEPSAGEKVAGWATNDVPPSSYFNWFQKLYGEWLTYLDALGAHVITWTVGQIFQAGITVTTSGNGTAITATGSGNGEGIVASGGTSGSGGIFTAGSSAGFGVDATASATNGTAVRGVASGGNSSGVLGGSTGAGSKGVTATSTGSGSYGVDAMGDLYGVNSVATAYNGNGFFTVCTGSDATGIYANASGSNGTGANVRGYWGAFATSTVGTGATTNDTAGLTGHGNYAYGVIASSGDTERSAFRIVPQSAQPDTGQVGDLYVDSSGNLYICTVAGTPGSWAKVGTQT